MSPDFKECEALAMHLSAHERATLAARLLASLDERDDTESERLWVDEAERRYQEYKQGRISARPANEALHNARTRLRGKRRFSSNPPSMK
ncbi:MAG TPA: addiction module protein [Armatimonadota bacterium]|nr:addiction module protein [Armatimonadota bacterium]HOS42320.1 addiction module protein [Armatimonadota bacterium]